MYYPADLLTILELQDQEIRESGICIVQERRTTDFEAPKLRKGMSSSSEKSVNRRFRESKTMKCLVVCM